MRMGRREFVRLTGLATGGLYLGGGASTETERREPKLEAFIVSDAHLGWDGKDQPSPQEQRAAMRTILQRFPELDLFIDTGDAHHGNARKEDWGNWLDLIPGGCPDLPFYYTSGNHEMGWGRRHAEDHVGKLGSLSCRPYYSYTIKGIHFVSVPQLIKVNYVTEETLDWLRLDLQVHPDQTTILLSHNELRGTTEYFDSIAYRQVANSDRLFRLIEDHPQVVAWCHGHNHTYEIVRKGDVFYVSNGRIGGFSPPGHWVKEYGNRSFGRDHLGGIHIRVTGDALLVRAFSATANRFISELTEDEIGPAGGTVDHLSQTMKVKTSLEPSLPASHCFGVGGALDGVPVAAFRHHLLDERTGTRTLHLMPSRDRDINENGDFSSYTVKSGQFGPWIPAWKVEGPYDAGATDGPKGEASCEEPGILLLPSREPRRLVTPHGASRHSGYYKHKPAASYRVEVALQTREALEDLKLEVEGFLDEGKAVENPNVFRKSSSPFSLDPSQSTLEWTFAIPGWSELTSTPHPAANAPVLLSLIVHIPPHEKEIAIQKVEILRATPDAPTMEATLLENGRPLHGPLSLKPGKPSRADLSVNQSNHVDEFELKLKGTAKASWLIEEEGIRWQVRNAPVGKDKATLTIGPPRCDYSSREEVLFIPRFQEPGLQVLELRHIPDATITRHHERTLTSLGVVVKALSQEEGEIVLTGGGLRVDGAEVLESTNERNVLKVRKPGTVSVWQ